MIGKCVSTESRHFINVKQLNESLCFANKKKHSWTFSVKPWDSNKRMQRFAFFRLHSMATQNGQKERQWNNFAKFSFEFCFLFWNCHSTFARTSFYVPMGILRNYQFIADAPQWTLLWPTCAGTNLAEVNLVRMPFCIFYYKLCLRATVFVFNTLNLFLFCPISTIW